jgi:hypothetical protein
MTNANSDTKTSAVKAADYMVPDIRFRKNSVGAGEEA